VASLAAHIRPAEMTDADAIADVIAAAEPDLLVSEIDRDERRDRISLAAGDEAERLVRRRGRRSRRRRAQPGPTGIQAQPPSG
jgi:hypothetical protein